MQSVDTSAEAVEAMAARCENAHRIMLSGAFYADAAAMLRRLHARATDAERERGELQQTFDLRWKGDMRGIKRWQEATGRTLTWPGHADAVVFLLEKLDAAEAALATARADALKEAAAFADGIRTYAEWAIERAKADHHPSEQQHQEGRWHAANDIEEGILSLIPAQEPRT